MRKLFGLVLSKSCKTCTNKELKWLDYPCCICSKKDDFYTTETKGGREMCLAEKWITTLNSIIGQVKGTFDGNYDEIGRKDLEQQDLLHEIELANLNAAQRIQVYNKLRDVRLERRRLKDENEALYPLYKLLKDNPNMINWLRQTQGNINRITEEQKTRTYTPRVREDLTIGGR